MSTSFGGYTTRGGLGVSAKRIDLDYEHPLFLDLNIGNAAALLGLLRLEQPYGECTIAEARRAVMYARGTFSSRATRYTREPAQGEGQFGCRFTTMGLDADGLQSRLERFSKLVEFLAERGATHVCWG